MSWPPTKDRQPKVKAIHTLCFRWLVLHKSSSVIKPLRPLYLLLYLLLLFWIKAHVLNANTFEFSLNVFTEIIEFSDKNICHYSKRAPTCHLAISRVKDQDAPAPARHVWETGSLNLTKFMFQWFIRFPEFSEFLFHLGKTPLCFNSSRSSNHLWYLTEHWISDVVLVCSSIVPVMFCPGSSIFL